MESELFMGKLPDALSMDSATQDVGDGAEHTMEKQALRLGLDSVAPGLGEVAEETGTLDRALKR